MKVHLAGTWGRGSFGDDCGVEAFKATLRGYWTDEDFVLQHGGRGAFSPTCQDGGILAGAGLLFTGRSQSDRESLKAHLRYPAVMQLFGKPTFLLGLGVRGRPTPPGMAEFLPILENARILTVRDQGTAERLRDAGVERPVLRSADLSYLRYRRPRVPSVVDGKPVLGVAVSAPDPNVTRSGPTGLEVRILEAIEHLEDQFELRFYCFDASDSWLPERWTRPASATVYDGSAFNVERFETAIREADILLTSRLDGAVPAALSGTPFVGMGPPGEEMESECGSLGHDACLTFDASTETIVESVRSAWERRHETYEPLRRAAERQRRMAERSIDLLAAGFASGGGECKRLPEGARRLLVWASPDSFFPEVRSVLDNWGRFDLLASIHSGVDHPNVVERLVAPPPGLIHWATFPPLLRGRLEKAYEAVVVFHARGEVNSAVRDLAGRCRSAPSLAPWEYRIWTHDLGKLETAEVPEGMAA